LGCIAVSCPAFFIYHFQPAWREGKVAEASKGTVGYAAGFSQIFNSGISIGTYYRNSAIYNQTTYTKQEDWL